jgi:putative SOS response-associated peptidase YedK
VRWRVYLTAVSEPNKLFITIMAERLAFFATKNEIESYFNIETKKVSLFEPNYNISPGVQIPAVLSAEKGDTSEITRIRWGAASEKNDKQTTIQKEELLNKNKNSDIERCVLPISGFYVWKHKQKDEHPFFVRMLNSPVMAVAGLIHKEKNEFVTIVTTESNPLIQPMSEQMPLMFDTTTAGRWLDTSEKTSDVLESASKLYVLTDLSVLRVSRKVNDISNNDPKLIQPIPK